MDDSLVMRGSLDLVASAALARYDFSPESTITLINVSENSTYRIDDQQAGRCAAMRVHRPGYQSEAAIQSELCWMDALRESGIVEPPRLITARDGSRVTTVSVDGMGPTRHVVLFDWLPGDSPSTKGDLAPAFQVLGSLAARLHSHARTWQRPTWFTRYSYDYEAGLGPNAKWGRWQNGLGLGPQERGILGRLDFELQKRLAAYGKRPQCFGLAHNDLRLANLLVDGEDMHVLDFDDCGFAWYMHDFAGAVSFIEDDPRLPELMAAWVDGYNIHTLLRPEDEEILPTMVMFRRLVLVGWVGSHQEFAAEAVALGARYTNVTCNLAESYLSGGRKP